MYKRSYSHEHFVLKDNPLPRLGFTCTVATVSPFIKQETQKKRALQCSSHMYLPKEHEKTRNHTHCGIIGTMSFEDFSLSSADRDANALSCSRAGKKTEREP